MTRLCRSLLHSVNLILFTLLLVHLTLHTSPHHSHHLRSHHLSLPRPITQRQSGRNQKRRLWTKGFLKEMSFKSGVIGRGSDRWWLAKVVTVMRWCVQDEVNQEESEQNEVDGMKKGPITSDLKLISFRNPFLHSLLFWFLPDCRERISERDEF